MSRKPGLALQVAILMGAGLLATPAAAGGAPPICPDTYCGLRAYPDPYIWDGYRYIWPGYSRGYKGPEFYGRSFYLIKTLRPVYIPADEYRLRYGRTKHRYGYKHPYGHKHPSHKVQPVYYK